MTIFQIILCAIVGYLLGSVSTGIILSARHHVNIRSLGSKSTGATNVTRVMGAKYGALTFAGDFLKGIIAVVVAILLFGRMGGFIAGLCAVIGHNWPLYYRFKGGKGVSTSCAVFLILFPLQTLISMAVTTLVIYISRYVSVGSLTLLGLTTFLSAFSHPWWPDLSFCIVLFLIGLWRHRANISRLRKGTENPFSFSRKTG